MTPMSLSRLLEISGSSIGPSTDDVTGLFPPVNRSLSNELQGMLNAKNGFYAFEGALHVFPRRSLRPEIGLDEWNSETLWRSEYGAAATGCFFFSEDVFGGQFCFQTDAIWTFDPETGEKEYLAGTLEEWAEAILKEYDILTGYRLAHEWQKRNGPLLPGTRLNPKIPFVLGGEFAPENLYVIDSTTGMRSRANIARQIRNIPEGSQVRLKITE